MSEKEKWEKVLAKLVADTKSGEVEWARATRPNREAIVGFGYVASVSNTRLMVYEYEYRHYLEEEVWETQSDVAVEFVSLDGTLEWKVPPVPQRFALLEEVRLQTSGALDFANEYLGPDW